MLQFIVTATAILLSWPQATAAQGIGLGGCVANCGSSSGGGNSNNPYAGAMMDFNDPNLNPAPVLEDAPARAGARLDQIEDKVLTGPGIID